MVIKFDKILVIDLEATCWEETDPEKSDSEIIEIGLTVLNAKTLEREQKRSIIVKPQNSTVSEFCTKLTTLAQQDVDKGISLSEACSILKKEFDSKGRLWASFGDYDRKQFERECSSKNIPYPFGNSHLNVKVFFALYAGLNSQTSMDGVLRILNLPLEGTHHRGVDDSWNIALILSKILEKFKNK